MLFAEFKNNFNEDTSLQELELTKYVSLVEKNVAIESIVENVLEMKDNMWQVDIFMLEIYTTLNTLILYSNMEFDSDFTAEDYDFVMENKIEDYIIENCGDDYFKFTSLIQRAIEQELNIRNSISAVIMHLGTQLIEKLDQMSNPEKMAKMVEQAKIAVDGNPELMKLLQLEKLGKVTKGKKKKVK